MPFTSWPKKRPLVIDHTKVGTGTHTSYPWRAKISDATLASRLRPDGIDLVVTDSDGSTQINYERVQYAADLWDRAAWSWYTGDRAVYDSTSNSVFVTFCDYTDIFVGKRDLTADTWTVNIVSYGGGGDDHNHGCVALGSDRSVLTVATPHNGTTLALSYSGAAASISSWSTVTLENSGSYYWNYPHLFRTTDGKLHCFARRAPSAHGGWRDIVVYSSTSTSAPYTSWSAVATILDAATSIQDFTYHKFVFDSATDTIYTVGGLHPGTGGNLYAFKMTWSGSAWAAKKLDGTAITTPMTALSAGTLAYTQTGSDRPWIHDVALDGSGNLFAMFQTYVNLDTDHRMNVIRTSSNVFGSKEVIGGGTIGASIAPSTANNYYGGGGCFNPADPNEILISNGSSGTHEMQRWTYSGGSWSKAEDLTSYAISGRKNIRPFWIRSAPSGLKALWCEGTYTDFASPGFDLQLMTYPRRSKPICDITIAVPNLSNSADRTLYLYAGNMSASDQASAASSVYDAATKLVCHGRNKRNDASKVTNAISGNNGSKGFANSPYQTVSPLLSTSQQWADTSDLTFLAADLNANSATGLTVTSLVKLDSAGANRAIADSWADGSSSAQFLLRCQASTREIGAHVVGSDSAGHGGYSTLVLPTTGTHLVGLAYRGSVSKVYAHLDGTSAETASGSGLATLKTSGTATQPRWGVYNTPMVGAMEEFVIATTERTDGYLLTMTNNLTANSTSWSLGAETDNVSTIFSNLESGIRGLNRGIV